MVGDIWLTRNHGGPGLRGWLRRQIGDMITLIRPGRNLPWNHTMPELEGNQLLSAGPRVALEEAAGVLADKNLSVLVVRGDWDANERGLISQVGQRYVGFRYSYWTALGHAVSRRLAGWIARMDRRTVICSELTAEVLKVATGYRFTRRHSGELLEPDQVRPRDIAWSVSTSDGDIRPPWRLVVKTSHGKVVARGTA